MLFPNEITIYETFSNLDTTVLFVLCFLVIPYMLGYLAGFTIVEAWLKRRGI